MTKKKNRQSSCHQKTYGTGNAKENVTLRRKFLFLSLFSLVSSWGEFRTMCLDIHPSPDSSQIHSLSWPLFPFVGFWKRKENLNFQHQFVLPTYFWSYKKEPSTVKSFKKLGSFHSHRGCYTNHERITYLSKILCRCRPCGPSPARGAHWCSSKKPVMEVVNYSLIGFETLLLCKESITSTINLFKSLWLRRE